MFWNTGAFWVLFTCLVNAFEYQIDEESSELRLFLVDIKSSIEDLKSLHNGFNVGVSLNGIIWTKMQNPQNSSNLTWTTYLDGIPVQSSTVDFSADVFDFPNSMAVGNIVSPGSGHRVITVTLELNGVTTSVTEHFESFQSGVALIPLIVILVLAATTHMVELSLITGIFVGSCIVAGNLKLGFYNTLDTYLLEAIANEDNANTYLFTFILSGLIGMIMKSGGFGGVGVTMSRLANTPVSGQLVTYFSGLLIFFVSKIRPNTASLWKLYALTSFHY
jgi:hypothetical protein